MVQQRFDFLFKILGVRLVNLGGNANRHAHALGHFNGAVHSLLRRDAPHERQIPAGPPLERVQVFGQSVKDGCPPVGPWQRPALSVRNRYQRHLPELTIDPAQLGKIQPSVQRGQLRNTLASRGCKMQVIDVKVNHVEFVRAPVDLIQHDHVVRQRIPAIRIQPQRAFAGSHQLRRRNRVPAGEQSNLVSLPDQFLCQVRDYALRSAVKPGRRAFI